MARILVFAILLLLLMSGAAFAQGPRPPVTSDTTQVPVGGQDTATVKANPQDAAASKKVMSEQDKTFATKATMGNLVERQTSQLAIGQGRADTVEEFAQRMVIDHRNAQEQLSEIASALDISLPLDLDQEHEAMILKLRDERGEVFDRQYAEMQLKLHQDAVALYQAEAERGQNPELKEFAGRLLPVLQEHLRLAQNMVKEVTSPASR